MTEHRSPKGFGLSDSGLAMPRRGLMGLSAAALIGLGSATAARAQTPRPPQGRKGQIVVGLSQEPTRFNPLMARIETDEAVHLNMFNALWYVAPNGDLVPDLATEVPSVQNGGLSGDGLSWRIKLKPGVQWHDGKPFTAEDVKFTLGLLRNKEFPAMSRSGHDLVRDITVVSPTELTWKMERFYAPYFSILSWMMIVPKHAFDGITDFRTAPFNSAPIGTGAFKWGERRPGDYIRVDANPNYHGTGPYVERVIFKYVPDLTVLKTQFIAGAVDAVVGTGITPDNFDEVRATRSVKLIISPTAYLTSVTLNNGQPQFREKEVRQALYMAMDKATINRDLFYDSNFATESYLPAENWAYKPDLPVHKYDVKGAMALLDKAGWKPGRGGIREKGGVRLSFSISTVTGSHLREQMQQFLQQSWLPLGVEMSIKNFPAAVMWGDFWRFSQFDSTIVGAIYPVAGDPDVSDRLGSWAIPAKAGSGANQMQYTSAEVDKLLPQAAAMLDRAERKKAYARVQELVRDDLPFLPLHQTNMGEGTKANLLGFEPNVNYRHNCWNMSAWYWAS